MELRSSRSRSRTPYVQLTRLDVELEEAATTEKVSTTSTMKTEIVRRTRNNRKCKTSDYYSSEDEATEHREAVQNGENGVKSALQIYQEAGEYWNKFPKTDYTYSTSSKDRREVAPGVIQMPNMSRRSLRRSMEPSSTQTHETVVDNHSSVRRTLNFSQNTQNSQNYQNYQNYENYENYQNQLIIKRESVSTRITRTYRRLLSLIISTVLWVTQYYYKTVSRWFLFDTWLMQKSTPPPGGVGGSLGNLGGGFTKYKALFVIMLLPLLLFAGWMFWAHKPLHNSVNIQEIVKQVLASPQLQANNGGNQNQAIIIDRLEQELRQMKQENRRFLWELRKCCRPHQQGGLGRDIRGIIRDELRIYDADKTGLVDYALESSGGQIISTRCTENYHSRTAVVSVLGVPLWWPSNTPRVIISPGAVPGECWAFQNFPGFVLVQLSSFVEVTAVSVEHIPESLAPGGVRDSAPRVFTVWGLRTENDREPWDLGHFEYSLEGPALQTFPVEANGVPVNLIELRVESNHGNINYTCLYRFRVHGNLRKPGNPGYPQG